MIRVTSAANARVRDALRLIASSHERRRSGRCVLEGAHLVAVYRARVGLPESIVVTDDALAREDVRALIDVAADARTINVPTALLAEHAAIPADVGILAVVPTPRLAEADAPRASRCCSRTCRIPATSARSCAPRRRQVLRRC